MSFTARSRSQGKRSLHRWLLISLIAGTLLIVGIWAETTYIPALTSLSVMPELDLSGVESQVAAKILALQKDVKSDPQSGAAWGKLAMNLDIHDLKEEALLCYQKAAELDPTNFRWPYYCASMLAESGSPVALDWFDQSRPLNPNYPSVHLLYGQALFDAGRLSEAEKAFQRALDLEPKSSHAHLGLAQVALAQRELEVSREHLVRAAEINPNHGEVHGLFAEFYRRLNEPEKAAYETRIAQQLPKITPVPDPIYAELAAEGVSAFWYETRGRAYLKKGLSEQAVHEFTKALEVKSDAEAHNNLGFALQQLGRHEEAAEHYRQAIELKEEYRDALNNYATALFELGRVNEAIENLEKAKRLDPSFPDVYLNLGTFRMRSNRIAEAINAFREGLRNAPYDPRTAMKLAWLLATSPDASLRSGQEALRLAEGVCQHTAFRIPQALDVLAAAYAETGRYARAIETAHRARQLALSLRLPDLAREVESRIKFYQAGRPFRNRRF